MSTAKPLFALTVLLALTGCVNRAAQKQAATTQAFQNDTTVTVQVRPAATANLDETIEVTGSFATSEQSSIGPTVGGRLVSVLIHDGDTVTAGQVIAQLETTDQLTRIRQAQAQVDSARAALQQAQADARIAPSKSTANVKGAESRLAQAKARYAKAKNGSRSEERVQAEWNVKKAKSDMETAKSALDRAKKLFAEGAIAQVDVENAENRYQNSMAAYQAAVESLSIAQSATRPEDLEAARLDVTSAEESLKTARADQRLDVTFQQRVDAARANLSSAQEQVRLAQKALSDTSVRSPFSGRISGKPVQQGTFVAPGTPIATVIGTAGTYFEANVPETKVAQIVPGAPVSVTIDALKGVKLSGSVIAVNPLASGQGRLFSVRVGFNESIAAIKPGMFARGQVRLGTRNGIVVVPSESILRDGEETHVFVVVGNKAKRAPIKAGLQTEGRTEVTGVQPGDNVVVSGQSNLIEGSVVKIEEAKKGA